MILGGGPNRIGQGMNLITVVVMRHISPLTMVTKQ